MSDSRVLLLDDDPLILQAYQRSLRRRFTVETAEGPKEGLAKLSNSAYAVVVADMLMPGLTGLEILQRLRDSSPNTVGILLTGMGDYEQALEAINQGVVYRFLTKPCALNQLVRSIEDSLNYHRLLTQNDAVLPLLRALAGHQERMQRQMFGKSFSLAELVRNWAEQLQLPVPGDFEGAALLCGLGWWNLPQGGASPELELYESLAGLPRFNEMLEMATLPAAPWQDRLPEDLTSAPRAALGAHLLELARCRAKSDIFGEPLQLVNPCHPALHHLISNF